MAATHDSDATLSLGPLATPARPAVGVPDLGFAARYQLGARLAEGGLAIIYDAHDVVLDRKVAIKQLRDPDPGLTARFLREARLTSRLVHPGIVPIYDLGSDADGVLSYAMKWIAGRSLAHELAARPTLEARLALVPAVIAIAEAVAYAHSQRVIHRDLKPANVVVGAFGEIVVIDWGLARSLDEPDLPTGGGVRRRSRTRDQQDQRRASHGDSLPHARDAGQLKTSARGPDATSGPAWPAPPRARRG